MRVQLFLTDDEGSELGSMGLETVEVIPAVGDDVEYQTHTGSVVKRRFAFVPYQGHETAPLGGNEMMAHITLTLR